MARQKKILISLPDSLLDEADSMAYSQNVNRSEFIREAMKLYIKEKKEAEIVRKLKKGYEEMAEINLEYSDFCLEADSRQLQLYEDKLAECE
ncbi:MAG: ribbon-helix-helix protein, CopG family [Ruminococcaceae bacterium]|nr:ribbon-helix-helix protein, CopG family [Oscillospiraceae bacterium]